MTAAAAVLLSGGVEGPMDEADRGRRHLVVSGVASRSRQQLLRRNDHDALVALEILDVEGKELRQTEHVHGGNQSGIVGVFADNLMNDDQPLPLGQDGGNIVKQHEQLFELGNFSRSRIRRKTEPVLATRTL